VALRTEIATKKRSRCTLVRADDERLTLKPILPRPACIPGVLPADGTRGISARGCRCPGDGPARAPHCPRSRRRYPRRGTHHQRAPPIRLGGHERLSSPLPTPHYSALFFCCRGRQWWWRRREGSKALPNQDEGIMRVLTYALFAGYQVIIEVQSGGRERGEPGQWSRKAVCVRRRIRTGASPLRAL